MANGGVPEKRTETREGRAADSNVVPRGLAPSRRSADAVDALQCLRVRREITTRFIGSENSCVRMWRRSVLPSAMSLPTTVGLIARYR